MPQEELTDYQRTFQPITDLASYFKAKDLFKVKWSVIENCNIRLFDIFVCLNSVITEEFRKTDKEMVAFKRCINRAYKTLKSNQIIEDKFHNNGRSPEDVYYNWMRGYLVCTYFKKVIARVFNVSEGNIRQFGADNLEELHRSKNPRKFKKDPAADFLIPKEHLGNQDHDVLIEVQSGFTGINDIKQTKAKAAKKRFEKDGTKTVVFHFDLYFGRLAIFEATNLLDTGNWVKNDKLNGAITQEIREDMFVWNLDQPFPEDLPNPLVQ